MFLCGMQDGTLPITYAETPAAIEEERRLLYVGMTRARKHLSISWALARNPGGRGSRKPSRFLDGVAEVERSDRRVHHARAATARPRHCRECGGALALAGGEEDRPVRRLPRVLRRSALRAPARVAAGAGRRRQRPGVRGVHRRDPPAASPSTGPSDERGLLKISGVGASKLAKYGDDVLAVLAGKEI